MTEIRYTRNLFLRCVHVVYLFAFASLYVQIPGLYGKNGILPARTEMDVKESDFAAKLQKKPTLLWFAPYLGLDTEYMMDVLALVGMFLAFTGFISQKFCTKPSFAALWSLYYSLYQVGQTFMWFQWDVLLLETGFLCILVSPMRHKSSRNSKSKSGSSPSDHLTFWLLKWLLFRVMFSSGIVKLTSGCPQWWGLTALKIHFESMCIPTPLAWYSHHLPDWFLKLNSVYAIISDVALSPLFFFPNKAVRTIVFYSQVFLQLAIILTGNFNFYNYLTLALCLSLLDDDFFTKSNKKSSKVATLFKSLGTGCVFGVLLYGIYVLFGLKFLPTGVIESKIAFTKVEFNNILGKVFPNVIYFGAFSLCLTMLSAIRAVLTQTSTSIFSKIGSIISTIFYICAACCIFVDSLVPFSTLHPSGNITVTQDIRELHNKLSHLHLTNSYGLFRHITGVGGRPEVIIEGSNKVEGPWTEYQFLYKPGNINTSLPFVAPHQPRLDWQMWFAALGTYHQNPWMMSLAYRLLTGQPEVLKLIDRASSPSKPPKFIRASLFHYHYTPWTQRNSKATWTREKVGEYFPVFSKDHLPLLDYLKVLKILDGDKKKDNLNPVLINGLNHLRTIFSTIDPPLLMLSLFISGVAIIAAGVFFQSSPKQNVPTPSAKSQRRKK